MKKMLVRIVAIMLVTMSVWSICVPAFAVTNIPNNSQAVVSNKQGEARVRTKKDKNSAQVYVGSTPVTLKNGAVVTVLKKEKSSVDKMYWYYVSGTFQGKSFKGYIRHDYLKKKTGSDPAPSTPAWEKRYGTKLFKAGAVPESETEHFRNIIKDLQSWAKKTEDLHRTQYTKGFYLWETQACFANMQFAEKFDVSVEMSVRLFQEYTAGLAVDGKVGDQTKKALYRDR